MGIRRLGTGQREAITIALAPAHRGQRGNLLTSSPPPSLPVSQCISPPPHTSLSPHLPTHSLLLPLPPPLPPQLLKVLPTRYLPHLHHMLLAVERHLARPRHRLGHVLGRDQPVPRHQRLGRKGPLGHARLAAGAEAH